ncbi:MULTISPECIES: caspase family protein [Alphaproteobacteria]|uniref:caspase family protein n=1 Tax=Alphaproteobacteria TaxID=28211 RepID=UPI001572139A|nr:caspase family protein [Agrobacterium tumefaciens]NSY51684.1 caspase family protein [Agrobacterium tumefaciens]NTA45947.1 caspase family protein [Agrobacterium tumefaciens]WCK16915.1 caspase family protein [Agrobacterium tumefaciens]WIE36275.1 caspase family protein [Agrobacterium tumefaciens]|tara:strand:- start:45098 stop:46663 length:1566 start_codon:yes stop_codon:yes gene_type:complete
MTKKSKKSIGPAEPTPLLKDCGQVTAVIIAIEDYQPRKNGQIPGVDYAKADAEAFSAVLDQMFPDTEIHRIYLIDSLATSMSVQDGVQEAIHSTGPDDLLIFYYAGHGFHNGISNLITVWDSNGHNLSGTCLNLRQLIFDPVEKSACQRLLTFIDACAEDLEDQFSSRNVVSDMSETEFKDFVKVDQYVGVFLSCTPGQKSYGHAGLGHGVWSYHLVQALSGNAPDAIDAFSVITDTSLRDYLSKSVRRYVTKKMSTAAQQTPIVRTSASNRFAICEIKEAAEPALPKNDFTALSFKPDSTHFSHIETRAYDRLPGFSKAKGHFVPDNVNPSSAEFARNLLEEEINEEIDDHYREAKRIFRLRRDDIGAGDDTLDTDHFRFWIEVRQTPDDPSEIQIIRCLTVREDSEEMLRSIDEMFGATFDRVVSRIQGVGPDFDEVVRHLEDIEIEYGGSLEESERRRKATYYFPEGGRLEFDLRDGCVSICAQRKTKFLDILDFARPIALGGPDDQVKYLSDESQRV